MTDTGQVPGEGQPESAGMVEQPGVPAHGAYIYLSESPAEDEDLLLPGSQGAWGNEVPPPAPEPVVEAVHQPGPHEIAGRDSGSVDLGGVLHPDPTATPHVAPPAAPAMPAAATPPRRPLHLGPPIPDVSASPVRSLADRGPAGAPVRHSGPPTVGPEYLDVQQQPETAPQGAAPWGVQTAQSVQAPVVPPVGATVAAAETVVPGDGEPVGAAQAAVARLAAQAGAAVPAAGYASEGGQPPQDQTGVQNDVQAAHEADGAEFAQVTEGTGGVDGVHASGAGQELVGAHGVSDAQVPGAGYVGPSAESVPAAEPDQAPDAPAAEADPAPEDAQSTHGGQAPEAIRPPQAVEAEEVPEAAHGPEGVQAPEGAQLTEAAQATDGVQVTGPVEAPAEQAPAPEQLPVDASVTETIPQPEVAPVPVPEPEATPHPEAEGAVEPTVSAEGEPSAGHDTAAEQDRSVVPAAAPADEAAAVAEVPAAAEAPVTPEGHQEAHPEAQAAPEAPHSDTPLTTEQAPAEHASAPAPAPAAASPEGAPLPSSVPAQAQPGLQLGQFVPVEGIVPTTPHLAPTPPHPLVVPTDQPAAQPQAQPEAQAQTAPQPQAQTEQQPEAAQEPQPRPAEGTSQDPVAMVPAPRDGDTVPAAAGEEPDPAVVQHADDLDTQVADQEEHQEEGTAAVAEARQSTGPAAPGYDEAEREAVLKVMRERRDIRNGFRSDPIPHEVLLRVLEAAHTAPSVGHSQPWDFVVIRSADTRRAMHELAMRQRDAYAKSLPKGRAKQFKELKIEAILDTPVNIVVTADPTRGGRHTLGRHTQPQMAPYSAALAVENLWLAARAEGLGVGWVSFFDEREMVRALGLPEHLEVIAYLCVGYVDEFPDEPELMQAGWSKRRPLSWVVHEETYGRRALPGEEPHDLLAETVAQIRPLDAKALGEAWERQKRMTKPAGALGMLEIISAQLSGLSRQCPPPIPEPAAVAIFAGDHGVHAQGVTPWPQEVTAQMVANFLGGGAVCNAFAAQVGAEVCVIDVGVAADLPATPGLLPRKVRAGTSDMTTGPAMTREEAKKAIEVGIETARDLVAAGNKALLTGEMGIANTTASAALISVYTGADPAEVTGRGTGINDETLARKTEVVRRALELHQPDPADPIGVLAAIGGFEHAAMVGLLLGGASLRTPVILDGVSAGAAALVARAIAPEVLAACIAGHRSAEPGHVAALNKLGLRPLVDLDLRLGEGTGALLALPLVQSTARAMHEVATFDSAGVTEK
ncbi:nicotinate-nucleotide--dimethylbenzimidazole phosphoribosyltransferase [Streptomyces sp. NRRL S-813]|uniref:nicotinate-nucleotide--dimethylbenzimidazole phosphoribosyltransferase n=1 Tax=Streptomyces sp. NRRL S-813 TaxID=1463919 RepID=UPI0004C0C0B4|nr:nicotinate-nucleotide--dimethylbenzimidazole phosphoribosyltransferase [Streptomyces sp. NRRL S-813]